MEGISLRQASVDDHKLIRKLFADSIQGIDNNLYDQDQKDAWASGIQIKERWIKRINEQYFVLAEDGKELLGFSSIDKNAYLDLMFISPDHQRKGIASILYQEMERKARSWGLLSLSTDSSLTAFSFFEKMGLEMIKKQVVVINNISIINFRMKKVL